MLNILIVSVLLQIYNWLGKIDLRDIYVAL